MNAPQGNQYLLEIGTEELPLEFLLSAPTELTDKVKAALDEQGLSYGEVNLYATPRRLALLIKDLPELQEERAFKTKGPPIRVALDASGNPSQAGLGFARKLGVDFSQLAQETIEGETYMVLNQTAAGRPTKELLAELLPTIILSLSGSHFMAWGSNTIRFSRPIRWLASLWNSEHLPLSIGPVQSDVVSHGHRVLADGPIRIESAEQYLSLLEKDGAVMADQARRKDVIWKQLQESAAQAGGMVQENESLLDTVNMLVEHPSIVVGGFEERFLEIPEEVTTTVMTAHQKYFPVREKSGKLMPRFMTVSNGRKEAAEIIRHGNEKVLTARLEDARFFFTEDQKIPLEDRLEALEGITFQKGLGNMRQKTARLEKLALKIAELYGASFHQATQTTYDESTYLKNVQRAARLAKADLVTGMVFEFTELQGVMGQKYALLAGEKLEVANAIKEHYDQIPESPVGITISLADKLDTIVAVFSQKNAKLPSGSKDPLGLRRMANSIIQTILQKQISFDVLSFVSFTYQYIEPDVVIDPKKGSPMQDMNTTLNLINEFILQRFRVYLLETGYRHDIIDAVLQAGRPLSHMTDVMVRLQYLSGLLQTSEKFQQIYEPANRVFRIIDKKKNETPEWEGIFRTQELDSNISLEPAEQNLLGKIQALEAADTEYDYPKLAEYLSGLYAEVTHFFEKVMVNVPDAAVRENRYNLLSVLNRFYLQLACFPKLVV